MFRSLGSIVALLVIAATPVTAQTLPCAAREQVLQFVIDQRSEVRLARGTASRGATLDLFAADSGTWSLVLHLPDGRSCLLANGDNFEATQGLQPARGNPA
jgi:hypothetical protein